MELIATTGAGDGAQDDAKLGPLLNQHRVELTGYCRWRLGSKSEAEDAVQETLLRAWRGFGRFEGRAKLRSWLYRIATNVCFDILQARNRCPHPVDPRHLGDVTEQRRGDPRPTCRSGSQASDQHEQAAGPDPADLAARRDSIRLAFLAALQHLPPRQRAVLILCEVFCWKAKDVAELLDCTVASVNSALQRARSTIAAGKVAAAGPRGPTGESQQRLLAGYVAAFERFDVETLVSLLQVDGSAGLSAGAPST
jgi:RNA polymerase sigma-70 factor (ECF subfamily)